jgi:hypothetical protein
MTPKAIALQIGRTALLCGGLGLGLYVVLTHTVEYPIFAPALALVLATVLALLIAGNVRFALRNALIPAKFRSIRRQDEPVLYWSMLAFEIACGAACLAIAILALLRIVG